MRSFYKYLTVKTHKLENDPAKDLEVPALKKALPKYLSLEQSIDLLNSVDGEFKDRDFCIITLLLNCGMRLSELVGIDISDIHEETITITGKGNKERQVYLNKACKKAIARYFHARNARSYSNKDRKALFLSRTGSRRLLPVFLFSDIFVTPVSLSYFVNGLFYCYASMALILSLSSAASS